MGDVVRDDRRDDRELIEAINDGEAGAFETLYYRYRDWVAGLAGRFTGNAEDALDVLQETFAYLSRKLPGLVLTAKLTTFLYPVVKNLSIAQRRKRGRLKGTEDQVLDQLTAPPAGTDVEGTRKELAQVMAGLHPGQREVVLMRFVDGMSLEEIAKALGIPLGTVKSRLHNALEAMRGDARVREWMGK